MTNPSLEGRIIWNEIHTADLEATLAFYRDLFGWTTRAEELATYTHFYLGDKTVAGLMPIAAGSPVPPHWAVYVGTADAEAYMQRAVEAGGKALMPLMDLPETGKISAVADGEGAVLSPFQPANTDRETWVSTGAPGTFCWVELLCRDADAARAFYGKVAGWEMRDLEMGDGSLYTILAPQGAPEGDGVGGIQQLPVGGIQQLPEGDPSPSCWLSYIAIEDIDASTAKVTELGGKVMVPPTEIPGMGRFSVVADNGGSVFAMYWSVPRG